MDPEISMTNTATFSSTVPNKQFLSTTLSNISLAFSIEEENVKDSMISSFFSSLAFKRKGAYNNKMIMIY